MNASEVSSHQEPECLGPSMRMFQIMEDDLAALEHTLPSLMDMMTTLAAHSPDEGAGCLPRIATQWRRVQKILMDVRWNYGPHTQTKIVS